MLVSAIDRPFTFSRKNAHTGAWCSNKKGTLLKIAWWALQKAAWRLTGSTSISAVSKAASTSGKLARRARSARSHEPGPERVAGPPADVGGVGGQASDHVVGLFREVSAGRIGQTECRRLLAIHAANGDADGAEAGEGRPFGHGPSPVARLAQSFQQFLDGHPEVGHRVMQTRRVHGPHRFVIEAGQQGRADRRREGRHPIAGLEHEANRIRTLTNPQNDEIGAVEDADIAGQPELFDQGIDGLVDQIQDAEMGLIKGAQSECQGPRSIPPRPLVALDKAVEHHFAQESRDGAFRDVQAARHFRNAQFRTLGRKALKDVDAGFERAHQFHNVGRVLLYNTTTSLRASTGRLLRWRSSLISKDENLFKGGLSMTPGSLLDRIDDQHALEFLASMVRIKTYSGTAGEGELARFMAGAIGELGMTADLTEVEPGRLNAIGRWPGAGGGSSLLFNGHLDTNPATDGWTVDPLGGLYDDDFIYGIGVSNMKAGDAAAELVARLEGAATGFRRVIGRGGHGLIIQINFVK